MDKTSAQGAQQIYDGVTLVTGNNKRRGWTVLIELGIYCAAVYYVTHPDVAESIWDRLVDLWRAHRDKAIAVQETKEAIQSLPEMDHPA